MKFGGWIAAAVLVALAAPAQGQQYSDSHSFLKAVKERDGAKVEELVSTPGSIAINSRERGTGEGGLHIVVRNRDLGWLRFLTSKGAKPDIQDNRGNTPLTLAAQIGWVDGAQLLLGRRASVDLPNNSGETPLILAVQKRDLAMVRLLLASGADPKRTDSAAGYSAIDYAKRDNRSAAILKLLEAPPSAAGEIIGPGR